MHISVQNLNLIKNKIKEIINRKQLKTYPEIIAVSKTFDMVKIMPLIESGHLHFGENKIQEAENKWSDIKEQHKDLQLHMVGKLQSNKAKKAVKLFDYIHSLDSSKLAAKLNQYEKELNKKTKIFIQVNVAEEDQKSGVSLNILNDFYNYCVKDLSLKVIGLMTLPPLEEDPIKYFKLLKNSAEKLNLNELSIGMSGDYEKALDNNSTFIRLGTAIFGSRKLIN
jgi:pyridoxal phosphate enzyme (YggS family)